MLFVQFATQAAACWWEWQIAAVKMPLLVSALVKQGAEVRCVLDRQCGRPGEPWPGPRGAAPRCRQWSHGRCRPLHIELAEWAELVLLAPLSATTLGRWVHGLADTLLASTLLATEAPVLAAAAMNTSMWQCRARAAQLAAAAEPCRACCRWPRPLACWPVTATVPMAAWPSRSPAAAGPRSRWPCWGWRRDLAGYAACW
jgi:hypothetical protein